MKISKLTRMAARLSRRTAIASLIVLVFALHPGPSLAQGSTALERALQTELLCEYRTIYLQDPKTNEYEIHLLNLAEGHVIGMDRFDNKDFMLVSYYCIQHEKAITLMYAAGNHFKLDL